MAAHGKLSDHAQLGELRTMIERLITEVQAIRPIGPPAHYVKVLSPAEAAAYLGRSIHRIYPMVHEKKIPFRKQGQHLQFLKDELDAWLAHLPGNDVRSTLAHRAKETARGERFMEVRESRAPWARVPEPEEPWPVLTHAARRYLKASESSDPQVLPLTRGKRRHLKTN